MRLKNGDKGQIVCIGVAPWGNIEKRDEIERAVCASEERVNAIYCSMIKRKSFFPRSDFPECVVEVYVIWRWRFTFPTLSFCKNKSSHQNRKGGKGHERIAFTVRASYKSKTACNLRSYNSQKKKFFFLLAVILKILDSSNMKLISKMRIHWKLIIESIKCLFSKQLWHIACSRFYENFPLCLLCSSKSLSLFCRFQGLYMERPKPIRILDTVREISVFWRWKLHFSIET